MEIFLSIIAQAGPSIRQTPMKSNLTSVVGRLPYWLRTDEYLLVTSEFEDLPSDPSQNRKYHSAQAGPSVSQTPRLMDIDLKPASVPQGEAPQAHVGQLEIQTPRTMEIASALVSLSLVEPSQ
ncbi:hypothetical protein ACTXT7_017495, partial [Hymenolepis weldensis]